ncbi:uncharacterized protein TRAVEDRAFT_52558 [Trametes versicolor FP-101664 SS1]|uniref:uncharacterized protein n=1 Tax=Trametes versicolor (strain FP-101664) TaxID=717944 RepID=UPI0004623871|nr:uncharacterized protein TRAVEDRAFT_52558 [Trametes versicolor FP-101664 SS1]EIW53430.1 hypothetical protein TRAVEDRAFT_52558 [Trametes versicolor FP-101664 SS1]
MASTSTSAAASASAQPPRPASFDTGYQDIFDAPERPREPSTHVRFAAAGPSRAAYSAPSPALSSLPPPVLFDGPARPAPSRSVSVSYRAYRAYPAKVWPRAAARVRTRASVAMSVVPLVVSGVGVGVLFGID